MYLEVRLHGRGGQGVVTASKIIAEAAHLEGYYSQSMPFFGAERRGAPVLSFARISDKPIYKTSQIYNPDIVVVFDPVLIRLPDIFLGLKDDGTAVLNSGKPMEVARNVVTVDATRIALKYDLLVAGMPVFNIPMLGALLRSDLPLSYETMKEVIEKKFGENERIIASFNEGYNRARKTYGRMRTRRVEKAGEVKSCEIPISVPAEGVAGRTELWRIIKPVVDREKCNNCMSCWLHCPEGVIMETEEGVEIDYTYCKGCMVCMTVCPKNAIRSEQEVIYNV